MLYPQQLSLLIEMPNIRWQKRGLHGEQIVSQCMSVDSAFLLKMKLLESMFETDMADAERVLPHKVILVVNSRHRRGHNSFRVCVNTAYFDQQHNLENYGE